MVLSIDQQIEVAGQSVLRARIYYDVWWFFVGESTRPKIVDAMQPYSEFFRFAPQAHLLAFLVEINALFERGSQTVNFRRLVKEIRNFAPSSEVAVADSLLLEAKPLMKKVAILRNNVIAHRNASASYNDWFREAAITPNQLRELTVHALAIANALLRSRGSTEMFFNARPALDAGMMLSALREHSQAP